MNVGFYRYSLLNRGGDRLIIQYANHLANSGHVVSLYVRVLDTEMDIDPKVAIKKIPWPGKFGAVAYGAYKNLQHDAVIVDIIHLAHPLSLRNTVIYYAQADDVEYYKNSLPRKCINMLYQRYFMSKRPVISMSQHLTEIFKRKYGVAIQHTIPTGIDHATFYPDPDPALLKQKGAKRAIFYMHRGDAFRKGHDVAAVVFSMLDRDSAVSDNIELWICGNSMDERLVKYPVRNFGIVTDSRLRQLLSSADVFFYPSRHEGFGLFPLEAMACGCTVVTTTAIPYARGSYAILCAIPEDVAGLTRNLSLLIHDTTCFEQKKQEGIQEAGRYDLERSKAAFEEALTGILTGN